MHRYSLNVNKLNQPALRWLLLPLCSVLMMNSAHANEENLPAVATKTVAKATLRDWAFSQGIAQGMRREYLNFEQSGKVTYIASDAQGITLRAGSRVTGPAKGQKYGQLLARIDERQDTQTVRTYEAKLETARLNITAASARLIQAENNLKQLNTNFTRVQKMWDQKLIPREQFEESKTDILNAQEAVKSAKAELASAQSEEGAALAQLNQGKLSLEKTNIFAPFDGVVTRVNIRHGDYWSGPAGGTTDQQRESSAAIAVVDTSRFEVTLNVPYYAASKLQEQQLVYISTHSQSLMNGAKYGFETTPNVVEGRVFSVSPSISLGKRAIEVLVHTTSANPALIDGQFVTAWIITDQKNDTLSVPSEAILRRDNRPFVVVIDDQNKASFRAVETGIEDLSRVEIISGVSENEQVVVVGQHLLVEGAKVRVVSSKTSPHRAPSSSTTSAKSTHSIQPFAGNQHSYSAATISQ